MQPSGCIRISIAWDQQRDTLTVQESSLTWCVHCDFEHRNRILRTLNLVVFSRQYTLAFLLNAMEGDHSLDTLILSFKSTLMDISSLWNVWPRNEEGQIEVLTRECMCCLHLRHRVLEKYISNPSNSPKRTGSTKASKDRWWHGRVEFIDNNPLCVFQSQRKLTWQYFSFTWKGSHVTDTLLTLLCNSVYHWMSSFKRKCRCISSLVLILLINLPFTLSGALNLLRVRLVTPEGRWVSHCVPSVLSCTLSVSLESVTQFRWTAFLPIM